MITRTRLKFERDFVQIPNEWLRDGRLSHRARGILAEIMTHAEGWVVTVEHLVENGTEGRDAVRTAVGELVEFGYLTRRRLQTEGGKLAGSTYDLTDPTEALENRLSVFPSVGESAPKNTNPLEDQEEELSLLSQPEATNPDFVEAFFEKFWEAYPKDRRSGSRDRNLTKFRTVVKNGADPEVIVEAIKARVAWWEQENTKPEFRKTSLPWLNQGCWEEEVVGLRAKVRPIEDAYAFTENAPRREPNWPSPWLDEEGEA